MEILQAKNTPQLILTSLVINVLAYSNVFVLILIFEPLYSVCIKISDCFELNRTIQYTWCQDTECTVLAENAV